jgi:CRISPR/Cas system CSM-associated protein Csm3 (group 7 of RAMP superfamily)
MKDIEVKFHWKFAGPLHVGVGLSAAGYADRLVRLLNGMPQIPGEAVKGAIRGSAERIARWLEGIEGAEAEDNSAPRNRVLQRLFASGEKAAFYRFQAARFAAGGAKATVSATAIGDNGVALDETLRTVEVWSRGADFEVVIRGYSGCWDDEQADDWRDLLFLKAAILATEGLGGKKGIGYGQLTCCGLDGCETLKRTETVRMLREHLQRNRM